MSLGNFKTKVKPLLLPSSRRLKFAPDDWSDSKITLYDMSPSPQTSFDKPVVVLLSPTSSTMSPAPLHNAKRSTRNPTFLVHFPNNLIFSNLNKTTEKRKASGMFASVSRFGSGTTRGVIKRRKRHVPPSLHHEPASPEFLTADARRRQSQKMPEKSLSRTFNSIGNALSYIKVPYIPGVSSLLFYGIERI